MTNGSDLDHNFDLWILKFKLDLDLWPHTWPWPWIFMVKFWNSCISEWEGRLTLHKGCGSRAFMAMTIWWSRSGVWISQRVTGVTSVVRVPSTHLVYFIIEQIMLNSHWNLPLKAAWSCNFVTLTASSFGGGGGGGSGAGGGGGGIYYFRLINW